jgi:hypothetical protein
MRVVDGGVVRPTPGKITAIREGSAATSARAVASRSAAASSRRSPSARSSESGSIGFT